METQSQPPERLHPGARVASGDGIVRGFTVAEWFLKWWLEGAALQPVSQLLQRVSRYKCALFHEGKLQMKTKAEAICIYCRTLLTLAMERYWIM